MCLILLIYIGLCQQVAIGESQSPLYGAIVGDDVLLYAGKRQSLGTEGGFELVSFRKNDTFRIHLSFIALSADYPAKWHASGKHVWFLPVGWFLNSADVFFYRYRLGQGAEGFISESKPFSTNGQPILREGQEMGVELLNEDTTLDVGGVYPGLIGKCKPLRRVVWKRDWVRRRANQPHSEGNIFDFYDFIPRSAASCWLLMNYEEIIELWEYSFVFTANRAVGRWKQLATMPAPFQGRFDCFFVDGQIYFIVSGAIYAASVPQEKEPSWIAKRISEAKVLAILEDAATGDVTCFMEKGYAPLNRLNDVVEFNFPSGDAKSSILRACAVELHGRKNGPHLPKGGQAEHP